LGFIWDAVKISVGITFVILVLFLLLSGKLGEMTPVFIILIIVVILGGIVFYIWKYRSTTIKKRGVKKKSHWKYLYEQMRNNNIPGVYSEDEENFILNKPKNLKFSMIASDHHLLGFNDNNGKPAVSFYDIDNEFDRGILWSNIDSRNEDALKKSIEILEEIKKGETLKVKATPQQIEREIQRIETRSEEDST